MTIEFTKIKVRELVLRYKDGDEEGVYGYNGRLNIRPKYQREFVYNETQRDAVIQTVLKGFPINTMYWARNQDDTFELLDGQQRTLSICKYVHGEFSLSVDGCDKFFQNLTQTEMDSILDYEVIVYICSGNDKERLDWFRTINIAGEKLTDQELLNINYTGPWLTNAKTKFSKTQCAAYAIGKDYIKGAPIRQEFLETVLTWRVNGGRIDEYMAEHQNDDNANDLWFYFTAVMSWVTTLFPNYRREMKGIHWGLLYNQYHTNNYDDKALEADIVRLMSDDEVTKKSGIYEYLLSNKTNERVLSLRTFTESQKRTLYERQEGVCPVCGKHFDIKDMQADHIQEWSRGGKTILENGQMVCHDCHKMLTNTLTH